MRHVSHCIITKLTSGRFYGKTLQALRVFFGGLASRGSAFVNSYRVNFCGVLCSHFLLAQKEKAAFYASPWRFVPPVQFAAQFIFGFGQLRESVGRT